MWWRRRPPGRLWALPIETEVDEEIGAHIELQTKRFIEAGMSAAAARAAALRRFGDIAQVRDECRVIRQEMEVDMRRAELRQELRMDAVFTVRTLRRSPGFLLVALITLALGIGASTAIFSVVNAVLLRPLPYRQADRTVVLWNSYASAGTSYTSVAVPEYFDYAERLRAHDGVAALRPRPAALVGAGAEPEQVLAYVVSPNLFDLLGAAPLLGRSFRADDGVPGRESVVVLSHALWVRRFGGDPAILQRRVHIGGEPRTIVGVMPPDVRFPDAPVGFLREPADLWIASSWAQSRGDSRGNQILAVLARRGTGVTPMRARADLDAVAAAFRAEFPARYAPPRVPYWTIAAVPLRDAMFGNVRPAMLVLAIAVGIVLLMACVNVANLLFARGTLRQRELAVRRALGAGRARLLRQLLTETTILALAGGALGVFFAWLGTRAFPLLAGGTIPRIGETRIDGVVLAFSLVISLASGLLVGMLPAVQQSQGDVRGALAELSGTSSEGQRRRRTRAALVVAQVALALVILVAAGLLGRSFAALQRVDPGFDPEGVWSLELSLPAATYDSKARIATFFAQLQPLLEATPGAIGASAVTPLPMGRDRWSGSFSVEGAPAANDVPQPHAEYAVVMPRYFSVMRVPLVAGREFTIADRDDARKVVIVDELLARTHWPGQSAVGKRISTGAPGDWAVVVGVVAHVRSSGPHEQGEGQLYLPFFQQPERTVSVVVRTSAPPSGFVPAMRAAVRSLDAALPVASLRTMNDVVSSAVSRQRFNLLVLGAFALVALTLASIGLYGVMSYLIAQRTREIGIRIALGEPPRAVLGRVVRESVLIALVGIAAGCALSLALSRALAGLLFGITPTDATTYIAISLLLLAVAVLASFAPARRATRIDPLLALRA